MDELFDHLARWVFVDLAATVLSSFLCGLAAYATMAADNAVGATLVLVSGGVGSIAIGLSVGDWANRRTHRKR